MYYTRNQRKKAKKIFLWFVSFVLGTGGLFSCSDYLDIVPDNTIVLEDYFSNKQKAYQPLAKVYWYLLGYYHFQTSPYMFGDEWLEGWAWRENSAGIQPIQVMTGQLNEQNPPMNRWGHNYQAIRAANTFMENIGMVPDMTAKEKAEWTAQVKFLKAFFYFELLQYYGPFVIIDKNIPLDAKSENMYLRRSKLEDCFDYIIRLINEAIPDLNERVADNDLGQVDRMTALAIKARVMLFRASPFYNGNKQMYSDFFDYDNRTFFPMDEKTEKWNEALDAVNEAIAFCERQGKGLYHFEGTPYPFDMD
ncbi:MAG: RagB/SusD family nutrient uptake outer membrane protein, partial [Candidatus Symbiothrix sp.]|nr:RagB/SusD family nutrient uptake outer membrane protein [Candidatus Symbiothrix sp.]